MFFHIDESGNTGNNLFDKNQPTLSYGVLSSKLNVDIVGQQIHNKILKQIGVDSIHANVLGVQGLTDIVPLLHELQKKCKFKFDYYFIDKIDYALTHFFKAVFDAGLNPAVKWDTYWTPLRYPFIFRLATLFDEELLKTSWDLCVDKNVDKRKDDIVSLLLILLDRLSSSDLDKRTVELMSNAFRYGINNPLSLDFGSPDQKLVSPNSVCFQFVVSAIARHIRKAKRKDALGITVDQQSQFNQSQIKTLEVANLLSKSWQNSEVEEQKKLVFHPLYRQLDREDVLGIGMPDKEIDVKKSDASIGLQLVDVYLWITNRMLLKKSLSPQLKLFSYTFLKNALIDGISMEGMEHRWNIFESTLPQYHDLTESQLAFVDEMKLKHDAAINALGRDGQLYNEDFLK